MVGAPRILSIGIETNVNRQEKRTIETTRRTRPIGRPRRVSDEEIYVATLMSLAESGGGFTIGQVAARVGVTPAAIRQRYGSRQKLIAAMARRRVEQTHARFDAARQLPVPRLEALETALVAELGLVETPRQLAHVFSAYTDLIADPAVAAIFGEEIRVMIDETRRLLGDARDAGEVDVEGSEPLARAVVAAAEGSMLIWALAPDGDLADRVREAIRLAIGSPG